ncbi:hypothetical protein STEG23_002077, partial [Scotinomys teguina]
MYSLVNIHIIHTLRINVYRKLIIHLRDGLQRFSVPSLISIDVHNDAFILDENRRQAVSHETNNQ